jgi:hypothetical protein
VTEEELREELEFHLDEEAAERQDEGASLARSTASRSPRSRERALIREDVRTLWTWTTLEQLVQDVRYALRTMVRYRLVVGLAMLSLALGIGANTAIYSFMDALLFRRSRFRTRVPGPRHVAQQAIQHGRQREPEFVLRGINGSTYRDRSA